MSTICLTFFFKGVSLIGGMRFMAPLIDEEDQQPRLLFLEICIIKFAYY